MAGEVKQLTVTDIMQTAEGWQVVCGDDTYVCQHVVIAAGPWSAELIKPLGYHIPMVPMRGHHQHFKVKVKNALSHCLLGLDNGFVMGAMEQGIRVTWCAEMANLDAPNKFDQLEAVLTHA